MAILTAALLSLLVPAAGAAVPAATNIGVAAAVRGVVHATSPQAAGRIVETGLPVYASDHVTTGADGRLQILLLDETTFTLGPNSDMVLDEFVYDPVKSAGKVSATMAKGVFRFVTGKVARRNPGDMKVKMPEGTIGIRGTMVAGRVGAEDATVVLIGPGQGNNADENPGGISVGNQQGTTDVDRSGYGVTVHAGQAPSAAFEVPADQLQSILNGVSTTPSGTGGGGGVQGSADAGSGQDAAAGKTNSRDALSALDAAMPDTVQFAAQASNSTQVFPDGISQWSDVRSIETGTAQYFGAGAYSGSLTGTFTFGLDINFGAKTIGGGGSNIVTTNGGSYNVGLLNYGALAGLAKVSLLPVLSSPGFPYSASQMDLTLVNKDGIAAKQAVIDLTVSNSGPSGSGTGTGSR